MWFAAVAAIAGLAALVSELVGEVVGVALVISSLGLLLGLLTLDRHHQWPTPLAWWIGVAMVPALLVGGMLSEIDERLLELSLICLGTAWMVVGWAALHPQTVSPTTP